MVLRIRSLALKRYLLFASLTSFILLPVCIVTHECGHWAVARFHGWNTHFHPAYVSYTTASNRTAQKVALDR